jgi:hypothetical protein
MGSFTGENQAVPLGSLVEARRDNHRFLRAVAPGVLETDCLVLNDENYLEAMTQM